MLPERELNHKHPHYFKMQVEDTFDEDDAFLFNMPLSDEHTISSASLDSASPSRYVEYPD